LQLCIFLTLYTVPVIEESVSGDSPDGDDNADIFSAWEDQVADVDEASKLFYLYFCIADMSLELQSRGRSVAQFQIEGVNFINAI
jgi:hypothetical protein